jgi:hypothetical protein
VTAKVDGFHHVKFPVSDLARSGVPGALRVHETAAAGR